MLCDDCKWMQDYHCTMFMMPPGSLGRGLGEKCRKYESLVPQYIKKWMKQLQEKEQEDYWKDLEE